MKCYEKVERLNEKIWILERGLKDLLVRLSASLSLKLFMILLLYYCLIGLNLVWIF